MLEFSLALVKQLHDPLVMALETGDVGMMGTVLLCETLLSLLPTMSTKDMPYHLLKAYDVTPINSGVMARERRLTLHRFASVVGGVLYIATPVVHRVFVPLRQLPADGRRQVVRMLALLEEIHNGDGNSLADKCGAILLKSLLAELLSSNLVPRKAVLMSSTQLVAAGCGIHSLVSSTEYVRRTFDVAALPQESRLKDFLKTAQDLCGDLLVPALEEKLLSQLCFVPRVVLHEGSLSFSAASYCVLSKHTLGEIRIKARRGTLAEEDCMPMLRAVEVTLMTDFGLDSRLAKKIAK